MNEEIITKGSLCSGTGALDAATPGSLRWVAETAEAPAAVLKREHPLVPNLGSISEPNAWPHVDLLTSGDPCQSMSVAGRQLASADERFLWPDGMRIIRQAEPKHIFLENVQNLVSVPLIKGGERGGVLKMRLDDLREAGYVVRWTVFGACAVGAPHHRHRWFLRAKYVGANAPEAERVIVKCGAPRTGGRLLLPTPTTRDGMGGPGTSPKREGGMNLRTVVTLLPTPTTSNVHGNTYNNRNELLLPGVAQAVHAGALLPTPRATDGVNGGPSQRGRRGDLAMGSAVQEQHWGKFAEAVALWEQILGRPAPEPTEAAPKGGRRLSAALSEWMMGYPEGYLTEGVHRNEALRMAGNGVVVHQARAAWDMLAL